MFAALPLIQLHKVKSHVDADYFTHQASIWPLAVYCGNEAADALAKRGAKLHEIEPAVARDFREADHGTLEGHLGPRSSGI